LNGTYPAYLLMSFLNWLSRRRNLNHVWSLISGYSTSSMGVGLGLRRFVTCMREHSIWPTARSMHPLSIFQHYVKRWLVINGDVFGGDTHVLPVVLSVWRLFGLSLLPPLPPARTMRSSGMGSFHLGSRLGSVYNIFDGGLSSLF